MNVVHGASFEQANGTWRKTSVMLDEGDWARLVAEGRVSPEPTTTEKFFQMSGEAEILLYKQMYAMSAIPAEYAAGQIKAIQARLGRSVQ